MSHTTDCATVTKPLDVWAPCTCFEPDTDWSPEQPCGGIRISVNGGSYSKPPLCEVHMKPWGHRRKAITTPEGITAHDDERGA